MAMANTYSIGEFARRIGRKPSTVRRWEQEGKITPKRLPSGHRSFDESDVRAMLGGAPVRRVTVVYCRVSGSGQKEDLASQGKAMEGKAMETYCPNAGLAVDEWIEEISGGMNFKRKKFLGLMDRIQHGEVERLIVAHKDRLVRFGLDLISHIGEESGVRDSGSESAVVLSGAGDGRRYAGHCPCVQLSALWHEKVQTTAPSRVSRL